MLPRGREKETAVEVAPPHYLFIGLSTGLLTQNRRRLPALRHKTTPPPLFSPFPRPNFPIFSALRQAHGRAEEPKAHRPPRRAHVQPGGHLREQGGALQHAQQAPHRLEVPVALHPRQADGAGGALEALQGFQGGPEAHPRLHRPVRSWYRYREGEHRHQLRHVGRRGSVPAPRRARGPLRDQGSRHHLHLHHRGLGDPQQGAGAIRSRHQRAAVGNRHLFIHGIVGLRAGRTCEGGTERMRMRDKREPL
mmetsp:Transcript_1090/g.4029  ORF Transcript_1090/g.4029 Transcript_1090/m.4029 type:complete len:250 (-) Transcript_1090:36-785(-)